MSAKAIREAGGKALLGRHLKSASVAPYRGATVTEDVNWDELVNANPWLLTEVRNDTQNEGVCVN